MTNTEALTTRELDVLTRMANGSTYVTVARHYQVAASTAEWWGHNIIKKLGASSIAHAVFIACQQGLLLMQPTGSRSGEVRIGPSLRLLRSLMAEGFSVSFIASRMGMGQSELSLLMNRMWVTTAMQGRIRLVFVELAGRDPLALGVHQRGYTRARNRGRAEGWEIVPVDEVAQLRSSVPHAA